jgi:hypothetical protein
MENIAYQKLERKILDGSLFDAGTDVVELAKDNGFTIFNAEMDDADGFIAVDDENEIKEFESNKAIGVNARKPKQKKKEIIAQELSRYYAQKQANVGKKLKYALKDTAILDKDNYRRSVLTNLENDDKDNGNYVNAINNGKANDVAVKLNDLLSTPIYTIQTDELMEIDPKKTQEIANVKRKRIENQEGLDDYCLQTPIQRKRDQQITHLFQGYVELYKYKEYMRITQRGRLFCFCIIAASVIIAISLLMLGTWLSTLAQQYKTTPTPAGTVSTISASPEAAGEWLERLLINEAKADTATAPEATISPEVTLTPAASVSQKTSETSADPTPPINQQEDDADNKNGDFDNVFASDASTAAKDIVAVVSVCVTILGSIFGLLTMIAKYVLPMDEEKNMQEIVKLIQRTDFKHEVVHILEDNGRAGDIVKYLNMQDTLEEQSDSKKK